MFTVGLNNLSNREQWLEATLKSLPAGLTILDAGAGECPYKKWCSHLNYISQDFGQYDGKGDEGLQMGSGTIPNWISFQISLLFQWVMHLWM
jgi:hypothetical protein